MKRQTATAAALTLLTTLGLAACGDDSGQGSSTHGAGDHASATEHNDADLTFVRSMIPHHEQAVRMARMAQDGATSPAVRVLADRIEAAQGPEIETMQGWLEDWGGDESDDGSDDGMDGMDHGSDMDGMDHGPGMAGMMSEEDLDELDASRGAAFDRMFLTMMIAHHEGAIEMAETEQTDGKNAEAKELARQIEVAQTREITEMKRLLAD